MKEQLKALTEALKAARLDKGLSQREVANLVGLPQGHISKIERTNVDLRTSNLVDIARVLGMELVLVPRQNLGMIKALLRGDSTADETPAYRLDEE